MAHVDLLELPYFAGIGIDALVALVDLLAPRHVPAGAVIMAEGDRTPAALYIATSGRIAVAKRGGGQGHRGDGDGDGGTLGAGRRLAELQAPTLVGELELFCEMPPVATVTALTDVEGFVLSQKVFQALLRGHHPAMTMFCFNVARVACQRLAVADAVMAAQADAAGHAAMPTAAGASRGAADSRPRSPQLRRPRRP